MGWRRLKASALGTTAVGEVVTPGRRIAGPGTHVEERWRWNQIRPMRSRNPKTDPDR